MQTGGSVLGDISTKSKSNELAIFNASSRDTILDSIFSPTILTKAAVISLLVLCCFLLTALPLYAFFNAMFFILVNKIY